MNIVEFVGGDDRSMRMMMVLGTFDAVVAIVAVDTVAGVAVVVDRLRRMRADSSGTMRRERQQLQYCC